MEQRAKTAELSTAGMAGWRVSKLGCARRSECFITSSRYRTVTDVQGHMDKHRQTVNVTAWYVLDSHPTNTRVDCWLDSLLAFNGGDAVVIHLADQQEEDSKPFKGNQPYTFAVQSTSLNYRLGMHPYHFFSDRTSTYIWVLANTEYRYEYLIKFLQ